MTDFVHLHVHTEYSLLDGASRIAEVTEKAGELGMSALAITDHGSMYGIVDFYKACKKVGIKPIIGCEFYVAPRTMADRTPHVDDKLSHLVLLAENQQGYQNLLKLASLSFTSGFYYKPRVDKEALTEYHSGLIALSGCLAGEVAGHLLAGDMDKARASAVFYRDVFGLDNYFLELQDHGLIEQKKINPSLIELAGELGIGLVATNDVHYVLREHADVQDVLLCIQTGKTVDDPSRMKFKSSELYLKSGAEMASLFGHVREALDNTALIAGRCQVEIPFGKLHLPDFLVPGGKTPEAYLRELCREGIKWRYRDGPGEVQKRLEYELGIIEQMGFAPYFLIVWDFIHFARQKGIPVGPGRGSAAGSLVAYVLGITSIDPLANGLLFERFLNPERISMPDIDTDICYERRGEVINYVVERYGADKVAQIITFGTMAARAAIRDVGRALSMPYSEVDQVAKLVPAELHMTIERALENSPDLKNIYEDKPEVKKLIDTAARLEGMPRHASTHAAGVVITKEPLTHYLPLYRTTDGAVTTQFTMTTVEELGLLKMDLLGLRTLTVIGDALRMIEENEGVRLDMEQVALDDQKAYELLCKGETTGVFQLESRGMRGILRELKPTVFEDIVALVALYRPGPLGSGMVEDFIKSKHGQKKVTYLHPQLEPILRDTYGVILYQEQVMKIASSLAGFTLGEADLLRRAMGKKKLEIIAGLRSQFIAGSAKNNVLEAVAGQIFDLMEYFAGYGFNKSHSAAYALVSYQTAYLKANYPAYYMAALLTSVRDNTDKVALYIEESRRMGIEVLPPDVNESRESFTVSGQKIRFGLAAIKNIGVSCVEEMLRTRDTKGPFKGFADYCRRLDTKVINRRVMESMIKSGAFDSLGLRRSALMGAVDAGIALAGQAQKERMSGQLSLFDFLEDSAANEELPFPPVEEYPRDALLSFEKEALGLYITGHPLDNYRSELSSSEITRVCELVEGNAGPQVCLGGMINGIKRGISKKSGEPYAVFSLEDLTGSVQVVCFSRVYREYKELIQDEAVILVRGKASQDEEMKFIADSIALLVKTHSGNLKIDVEGLSLEQLTTLSILLRQHTGKQKVFLHLAGANKLYRAGDSYCVSINEILLGELKKFIGFERVAIVGEESEESREEAQKQPPTSRLGLPYRSILEL